MTNLLEPIRNALAGEPLLALSAGEATLACDATELIFADAAGVQRLTLRDIRKVTHLEGHLVVISSEQSIRGVLNVESAELKAFFADVQTLRKQRDAGLAQALESRFRPVPLETPGTAPLETQNPSPLEQPVPSQPVIPGFSVGISAAAAAPLAPIARAAPAAIPAPRAEPISAEPPRVEPPPTAAPIEDFLQYQPRPAKPDPRAGLRAQREELPPAKPNPRAAVQPAATPTAPSIAAPSIPAPSPEASQAPLSAPQRAAHAATLEPSPTTRSAPLERTVLPSLEKPRSATPSQPRADVLTQPRRVAPAPPSLTKLPKLELPKLELPKLDLTAVGERLRGRLAQSSPALRFNLRRTAASAIDAALSLALMWGATRIIGGRELETLLRLPNDTRADLTMLESLKDLLPLFIAGALSGVLAALAAGLLYAVIAQLSPLRGTPGRHLMGLRLTLLGDARVSPAVVAGRYLVTAMLLLVPSLLGLLPTLLALNGPAIALRSSLQLFGYANFAALIVLLIGQLPIYGANRTQTLADYLTDCIVRDAPKVPAAAPLET